MKDPNKISQNRQKKEKITAGLTASTQKAGSMIFTNYQGLTHQQLENFKKSLRGLQSEFVVAKNTLLLRALSQHNLNENDKNHFQKPTGVLFIYEDIMAPLKMLFKLVKELKLPVIKFGIIDHTVYSSEQIEKISSLPPLNILQSQLLGQMKYPITGLHRALNWNIQKLVLTLSAINDKKTT